MLIIRPWVIHQKRKSITQRQQLRAYQNGMIHHQAVASVIKQVNPLALGTDVYLEFWTEETREHAPCPDNRAKTSKRIS